MKIVTYVALDALRLPAQVGVVIHPEKDVKGDVLCGDGPKKATHD